MIKLNTLLDIFVVYLQIELQFSHLNLIGLLGETHLVHHVSNAQQSEAAQHHSGSEQYTIEGSTFQEHGQGVFGLERFHALAQRFGQVGRDVGLWLWMMSHF
jgi:hypothetical protein